MKFKVTNRFYYKLRITERANIVVSVRKVVNWIFWSELEWSVFNSKDYSTIEEQVAASHNYALKEIHARLKDKEDIQMRRDRVKDLVGNSDWSVLDKLKGN